MIALSLMKEMAYLFQRNFYLKNMILVYQRLNKYNRIKKFLNISKFYFSLKLFINK